MNTAKLKAAALAAGGEEWAPRDQTKNCGEYTVIVKGSLEKHSGWTSCRPVADEVVNKQTMKFIALANPAAVLELIAALEAAEKRGTDMEVACELFAESKLAQIKLESALGIAQQRLAELEARKLEVIIPPRRCYDYAAVAVQQRDEQWYKALHDACDRAGINLETGGE
ncbi:hypothetical protein SM093_000954 [Cronobacter malonaticus]|nr:hypothetical protein [Cronobacter malonaticus]